MSQAASKGREGVMPSGAEGTTQARSDVGLAGAAGADWKPPQDYKPEDNIPSKELVREVGDVDKVTPRDPVGAAKQGMEQDRGQRFTSDTGEGYKHRSAS